MLMTSAGGLLLTCQAPDHQTGQPIFTSERAKAVLKCFKTQNINSVVLTVSFQDNLAFRILNPWWPLCTSVSHIHCCSDEATKSFLLNE